MLGVVSIFHRAHELYREVEVQVVILGSPSLKISQELCGSRGGRPGLPVPKPYYALCGRKATLKHRAQELCESRSGRPGLPVPKPYGLCGRKATLKHRAQELCESRGGRPGLPVPKKPYGLCGHKAPSKEEEEEVVFQ